MALQKRWVIGNVLGWAIGFPTGLIGSVRLDDFYEGFVNPSEESLLFAVMFTVVVATCQWLSLNSNLRLKWTLGSFLGAFLGHFIIDTYSFYVSDIYFVRPIFFEFIGCTGLDIPPRWFPGLTGCYGVFPPVSAVILGLFIAIGQLWAAKLTYRWAIINAVAFFAIAIVVLFLSLLRLFKFNADIFVVGLILGTLYAGITGMTLVKELKNSEDTV